jgi:hypothetical protein
MRRQNYEVQGEQVTMGQTTVGIQCGSAADRVRRELNGALDKIRVELDRIELLSIALSAFSKPVPEYEPDFRHLRHITAPAIELKNMGS